MRFAERMLHCANRLIPKSPNRIYFFSASLYKDNIAAVVEELLKHDIARRFYVTLDGYALREYRGSNIQHVDHKSLASMWRFMRSMYIIYDNGIYGSGSTNGQIYVNTWHGMPLKRIGYHLASEEKTLFRAPTYVLASSPYFRIVMAQAFGVPQENVIMTGEPKNDFLFAKSNGLARIGVEKENYAKTIMWMPTYRTATHAKSPDDGGHYEFGIPLLTCDNIGVLDRYLSERRILLVIKYHSLQDIALPPMELDNIRFLTSKDVGKSGEPLYSLLSQFDALITDYSSVFISYLLLGRPICFAYDDIDLYSSKRGFVFENVESMLPGFRADSLDQLLQFIDQLSRGVDDYKDDRAAAARKYNAYSDNRNSYRLLKELGILS